MDYDQFKSMVFTGSSSDDGAWLTQRMYETHLAAIASVGPLQCFRGMVCSKAWLDKLEPNSDLGFYWSPSRSYSEGFARRGHLDICDPAFANQVLIEPVSILIEVEFSADQIDAPSTLAEIYFRGVREPDLQTQFVRLVPGAKGLVKSIRVDGEAYDLPLAKRHFIVGGENGTGIDFDAPVTFPVDRAEPTQTSA